MRLSDIFRADEGRKLLKHPRRGLLRFEHASFQANDDAALKLVIPTPARGDVRPYSGAALSPRALDSFEASEAITMTTAISAITSVQMALISGFTPSRTSE